MSSEVNYIVLVGLVAKSAVQFLTRRGVLNAKKNHYCSTSYEWLRYMGGFSTLDMDQQEQNKPKYNVREVGL